MSDKPKLSPKLARPAASDSAESPKDDPPQKLSKVEKYKADSHYLRDPIAEELGDGNPFFSEPSIQLLKHHGSYQQDDRDRRAEAKATGQPEGKFHSFMVRTAIPGGRMSSAQLLAELDICDEIGNTTLRITTRQGLQLHGILKSNLREAIQRIDDVQLTTLAACGDVKRNVMCTPCPYNGDPVHQQLQTLADEIAAAFTPQTPAYHEIWLTNGETGEKRMVRGSKNGSPGAGNDPVEPIYGQTYLPRKFKFAIGLPGDNSVDVYANDIGLLAVCEAWNVVGYNVLVGGSFGVTPSAKKTFPAIALPMCYVSADEVVAVCTAILKVQRDFGNRSDRKVARMKYLIRNWGLPRFKQKVEEYFGHELPPPRPAPVFDFNDGMGWRDQGDGRWFYGLNIENGRIHDTPTMQLKSALREVLTTMAPPLRLTPHQSILFCDIEPNDKDKLLEVFRRHNVPLSEDYSNVRRWAMACPALPTCGLAITESERILPSLVDQLEAELKKLGLEDEVFTMRMTGCPNGCARPYNSDIGLVGKTVGKYTIFLGGRRLGDRLNFIYKDLVPEAEVISTLADVFRYFKEARQQGETFGDFCFRAGKDDLLAKCGG